MLKNVAVDTGYGYGLMRCIDKKIIVPNVVEKIKKDVALACAVNITEQEVRDGSKLIVKLYHKEEENGVQIAPSFYVVGDFALNLNEKARRYVTNNRIRDEKHLVQLLSLAGISVDVQNADINLAMGLPTVARHLTKEAKEWLKDTFKISFLYKGGELIRELNIKEVEVVGQSIAPIFTLPVEDMSKKILSIDLGHKTNDTCLWNNKVVVDDYRHGSDGFKPFYSKMKELLLKKYKEQAQDFSENRVQQAVETGTITIRGNTENVEALQLEVYNDYAESVVDSITTDYEDVLDLLDKILLSGGIIENDKFYNILTEKTKKLNVELTRTDNSQWNVVNGLFSRVQLLFKDDFNKK